MKLNKFIAHLQEVAKIGIDYDVCTFNGDEGHLPVDAILLRHRNYNPEEDVILCLM